MKIDELKRSGSRRSVYSAAVADEDGQNHYELSISGSRSLIEAVFSKGDFEIEIAPKVLKDGFEQRSRRFLKDRVKRGSAVHPPLDKLAAFSATKQPAAAGKDTLLVYLRRTEGDGTFWAMWFPALSLPAGTSVLFLLPRVWTTWSVVVPFAGNPNLFLSFAPPPAPPISRGTLGGLSVDFVSFTAPPLPWTQFAAWHRVFAAAPGTVTAFGLAGHSIGLF